jgi:hypothetical protein
MAIRSVVTRGFGNGTFNGTIPLVVTHGYAIGVVIVLPPSRTWPIELQDAGRTWTPGGESRTWTPSKESRTFGVPVDKNKNL